MSSLFFPIWVTGAAIAAYAILGGADFGGGVWDLCASGPRAQAQRDAVARAMGPVWEANHVWLIFVIVTVFTCFPSAFAELSVRLYMPLTLVLLGVILRGTAFVFRAHAHEAAQTSGVLGVIFGVASLLTPFGFGLAVGTLITGDPTAQAISQAWYSALSVLLGCFSIALCAQVAAVFLTLETQDQLQEDFRQRAIIATLIVAAIGAATLILTIFRASSQVHFGDSQAVYAIGAAMLLGLVTLAAIAARRHTLARMTVVGEMLAILAGWFTAQFPYIVPPRLTFVAAAAPESTLRAFMLLTGIGFIFLVPALILLFLVFKGKNPAIDNPTH